MQGERTTRQERGRSFNSKRSRPKRCWSQRNQTAASPKLFCKRAQLYLALGFLWQIEAIWYLHQRLHWRVLTENHLDECISYKRRPKNCWRLLHGGGRDGTRTSYPRPVCVRGAFQDELDETSCVWDSHVIRPSKNDRVPSGRPRIMYMFPELYTTDDCISPVEGADALLWQSNCTFRPTAPCDGDIYNICNILMVESHFEEWDQIRSLIWDGTTCVPI